MRDSIILAVMTLWLIAYAAAIFALLLLSVDGQSSLLPLAPSAVETIYQIISLAVSAGPDMEERTWTLG